MPQGANKLLLISEQDKFTRERGGLLKTLISYHVTV